MAFVKNMNQQLSFNDRTNMLTERERKVLLKSWSAGFAEHIFPLIREEQFDVLYSDNPASRSNTPVNIIAGMIILKEMKASSQKGYMMGEERL
jgi:hypothetical protein